MAKKHEPKFRLNKVINNVLIFIYCAILHMLAMPNYVQAQNPAVIGAGALSLAGFDVGPIYRSSAASSIDYSSHYYLYTAAELNAAGIMSGDIIKSIAFYKDNANGTSATNNVSVWKIYIKNTTTLPGSTWSNSSFTTQSAGATLVYNNTAQIIPLTAGFITLSFSTPFVYTGGSLEIGSDWNCGLFSGNPATGSFPWKADNISNQCFGGSSNSSSANVAMSLQTRRPQIKIEYKYGTACSGAPLASTSFITLAPSCGNNFEVTQPFFPFDNVSYQWVESLNSTGPYAITSIADTLVTLKKASSASSMYYKCIVTCNNSVLSDSSAAVQVNPPIILGGNTNVLSLPGCATPSFSLRVAGATSGLLTYQWQDSISGGAWANTSIATASSTNTNLAATANVGTPTYFRRQTICASASIVVNSAPILINTVAAGVASATAPVCGDSLTLSLAQNTSGAGVTYQWEESADSLVWNPIAGAVSVSQKVISPTNITYYRCLVTCNVNVESSVSVKVFPVKGGSTIVTSSYCKDSTLLGLTGRTTGSVTLSWLSSLDSITWSPMGISAATPKFPASTSPIVYYRSIVQCGLSADTSIALKVNNPCGNFVSYAITRFNNISYSSIQATGTSFLIRGTPTNGDDVRSEPVTFPTGFNFMYDGVFRSAFYVCTNGWLSLDTNISSTAYHNDTFTIRKLILAPLWDDLVTLSNTAANFSLLKWEVQGTAPNRVMIIEWAEMERYQYGSPSLNFQVRMYEGSNNIEYVYGLMQGYDGNGSGAFTYSIGMTGNDPVAGQRYALLVPNTANFATATVNNGLTMIPLCNSSYLFSFGGVFNPTTIANKPTNDSSSTPTVLAVNPLPCLDGCGTYYTTLNATASSVGPAPVLGNPDDDVWFKFIAPSSGQVNINIIASSGFDPAFMVMNNLFDTTGLADAASRNAANNSLESCIAKDLTADSVYLIRVFNAGSGSGSTSGSFSICINEVIPPPINDDTTGAIVLNTTVNCTPVSGTTLGATTSPQIVCAGLADDDVWFKFTPSASVDTVTVVGLGTFRAHVEVLTSSMVSMGCQNINVNAGTVKTTLTGLLKDSVYFIRVYHTNAGTATANFTICITGDNATAPVVVTQSSSTVLEVTATLSGSISSSGGYPITKSGIVYGTSPAPVIGGSGVVDSTNNPLVTSGNFSINIAGLSSLTTYYYRAYASNILGTTYGIDSNFTTLTIPIAPLLTPISATNITAKGANVGGDIFNNGGAIVTMSGIVVGTLPNPSIGDLDIIDSVTIPNTSLGSYAFTLEGLTHSTKYYYRAYAINSAGIGYSAQDSFTTALVISSLPYNENFDGVTTHWTVQTIGGGSNAWERGVPSKTFINGAFSPPNAFVTKLSGDYQGAEHCVIVSPQFDFSSFSNDIVLRFMHKFKTNNDPGFDGLVVEISINGSAFARIDNQTGLGSDKNTPISHAWYNDPSALGVLGSNKFNGISNTYSSSANGWVQCATLLNGINGSSDVKFRFRFWSDPMGLDEGNAIDDIEIVEIQTPSTGASNIMPITVSDNSTTLSWNKNSGEKSLVIARLSSTSAVTPIDYRLYNASSTFSLGDSTGTGNFVVYSGNASSTVIDGLQILTDYVYDVYEYNGKYMHTRFATGVSSSIVTTLPVTFSRFYGSVKEKDVILNWETASEANNKGFEIQRSFDGVNFITIGFVKGKGHTNVLSKYRFLDRGALATKNVVNGIYYRLKQSNFDGEFSFSDIVFFAKQQSEKYKLGVTPNPFNAEATITLHVDNNTLGKVEITDVLGNVISNQEIELTNGNNTINLHQTKDLKPGLYFVKVIIEGQSRTIKIFKN